MTLDLDELERLGKAAVAAPWDADDLGERHFQATNHRYGIGSDASPVYRIAKVEGMGKQPEDTAEFIVAARNNWQAMIDRIRYLEADNDSLKTLVRFHERNCLHKEATPRTG